MLNNAQEAIVKVYLKRAIECFQKEKDSCLEDIHFFVDRRNQSTSDNSILNKKIKDAEIQFCVLSGKLDMSEMILKSMNRIKEICPCEGDPSCINKLDVNYDKFTKRILEV